MATPAPVVSGFADLQTQTTATHDPYVHSPEAQYANEEVALDATGVDPTGLLDRRTTQVSIGVDTPLLITTAAGTSTVVHAVEEIKPLPGLTTLWDSQVIGSEPGFLLGRPLDVSLVRDEVFGDTGKVTLPTWGYVRTKMALGNVGPLITSEPRLAEDKRDARLYKSVSIPREFEKAHRDPGKDNKTLLADVHEITKELKLDMANLAGPHQRYIDFICAMCCANPADNNTKSLVEVPAPTVVAPCRIHTQARASRVEKIFESKGLKVDFSGRQASAPPAPATQDMSALLGAVGDLTTAVQSGSAAQAKEHERRKAADAKTGAAKIMKLVGGSHAYKELLRKLGHTDLINAPAGLRDMLTSTDKEAAVGVWRAAARRIAVTKKIELPANEKDFGCLTKDLVGALFDASSDPTMDVDDTWTKPSILNTFAFDGRSADDEVKEEIRKARLREFNVSMKATDVDRLSRQFVTLPRTSTVKGYYHRQYCAVAAIADPSHWLVKFLEDLLATFPTFQSTFERWQPENGDPAVLRASHLLHRTNMIVGPRGRWEAEDQPAATAPIPDAQFVQNSLMAFTPMAAPISSALRSAMKLDLFVLVAPRMLDTEGKPRDLTSTHLDTLTEAAGSDDMSILTVLSEITAGGRGNPQAGSQGVSDDDLSLSSASSLGLRSAGGGVEDPPSAGSGKKGGDISKAKMTPPARLARFQVTRLTPEPKPAPWRVLKELVTQKKLPKLPKSKHDRQGRELCPSWVVNGMCDHKSCARAYDHKPYRNDDAAVIEMESWCTICHKPLSVLEPLMPIAEIPGRAE